MRHVSIVSVNAQNFFSDRNTSVFEGPTTKQWRFQNGLTAIKVVRSLTSAEDVMDGGCIESYT